MQKKKLEQLESLIAQDKELSNIFPPGASLEDLISKEDSEMLLKGKTCLKWIITPGGKRKCVRWSESEE